MGSYTRQETFDHVVTKLREQLVPSVDEDAGACFYRGPGGTKCAAGWCIPDDRYSASMEGRRCSQLRPFVDKGALFGHDVHLLENLQKAHDGAARECWGDYLFQLEESLRVIAEISGLQLLSPPSIAYAMAHGWEHWRRAHA